MTILADDYSCKMSNMHQVRFDKNQDGLYMQNSLSIYSYFDMKLALKCLKISIQNYAIFCQISKKQSKSKKDQTAASIKIYFY